MTTTGEKPENNWGKPFLNFPLSLGIGLALIILVELILRFTLDPETNIAYGYVAYLLGYAILFVMGFLMQSKAKMLLSSIITVIVSFIPPYFAPTTFVSLFTPFFQVITHIQKALGLADVYNIDLNSLSLIPGVSVSTMISIGYLIDLIIALFVVTIGALSLTLLAQTLRLKFKAFMTLAFYFSLVMILIFVIILPYLLIGISGIAQVGVDTATGAGYFAAGLQELQNQAFGNAIDLFNKASEWMNGSIASLQGLQDLHLAFIIGMLYPGARGYLDVGIPMLKSISYLAQSAGPLTGGIYAITNSFQNLFAYFDSTNTSALLASLASVPTSLHAADESKFELAIKYARESVVNLTESLKIIDKALQEQKRVSLDSIEGIDENTQTLYKDGVDLFSAAIKALEGILSPDSTTTKESSLIHLLLGLRSLNNAKQKMSGQTMLNGTLTDFQNVVANFTQVSLAFSSQAVTDFLNYPTLNGTNLADIQSYLRGTIEFFKDAMDTTIAFGTFGILISPIYDEITNLMEAFGADQDTYGNITAIPDPRYNNYYIPTLTNVYGNSTQLELTGNQLDAKAQSMKDKATNDTYGWLGSTASELADFILTLKGKETGHNVHSMAGKYLSLLKAFQSLKLTEGYMNTLGPQLDDLKSDPQASKVTATNQTLISINTTLTWAKANLTLARLNTTIGMTQLTNTDNAIQQIETNIDYMLISIDQIFDHLAIISDHLSDSAVVNDEISKININVDQIRGNMTEASTAASSL